MVDEKRPGPDSNEDVEGDAEVNGTPAESPWGGSMDEEIEGKVMATEAPAKRRGGLAALAALAVLALVIAGLYLSWPILQPRLLALLPSGASQTLAAVQELDHRVAQLEAANERLDLAIAAVKSAITVFSNRLGALSQDVSGSELLAGMGKKLSGLEEGLARLGQMAGENNAAALAALSAEVDDLKTRVVDLADSPSGPSNRPAISKAVAVQTQQTAALAGENQELRQTLAALQARLEQLERTAQGAALVRQKFVAGEGLVLAVGQLSQAVLAGGPYSAALAAVTALGDEDAAVPATAVALVPMAKAGIASPRALSDSFADMTRAVLQADHSESNGFWRRTLHQVTSLVTVRRVGEVDGMEADAILARAERRLGAGELAAAADLIAELDGPAGAAAADWLGQARSRLAALAALAELQSRAIAGLAGG